VPAFAATHPKLTDRTVWQAFEAERPQLVPISSPFDGFHATQASVSMTCLVRFDNNKYSISSRAVGRPVEIQAYADRVVIRQSLPRRKPRTGRSLANIAAVLAAARRSTTPGITCRCSPGSRARCGTAYLSRIGPCRPAWSGCDASCGASTHRA
jgi:hypothetical protein